MEAETGLGQKLERTEQWSDGLSAVHDDNDVTKRRLVNDYSAYKPISIEPGHEQIRLLQILPPLEEGNEDEELVCVIYDAPATAEIIVYVALSYCWGSMTDQRSISIIHHGMDGNEVKENNDEEIGTATKFAVDTDTKRSFNVTESLYQALMSVRAATPRLKKQFPILDFQPLWVDALCINQHNIEERNSQVGIMGSIYSKAWFVFVWLGESKDVMRGLNLIQAMVILLQDRWGSALDILDPQEEHLRILLSTKYKLDDELLDPESCFQILERLFSHPYFRRIWVLQEATINAESTFVHVTKAQVPWCWMIVADRFRQLWRRVYPTAEHGRLPIIWGHLLPPRLKYARKIRQEQGRSLRWTDTLGLLEPLYTLFINTYEEFAATDIRDKLYALLDLTVEARNGTPTRKELAPDYSKSVTEVFSNFTVWCIRNEGNLEVLSLLSGGPRRLLPEEIPDLSEDSSLPLNSYLHANDHPSWALWPTTLGYWAQSSLTKVDMRRGAQFDLASKQAVALFSQSTHPTIHLPRELDGRFLSLGGRRIGVVKSIMRLPLRCFASGHDKNPLLQARWATEEMQNDMAKHAKSYKLCLTHPYHEGALLEGGLVPLWHCIQKDHTEGVIFENEVLDASTQQWLGRSGGRYEGKEEVMFRDFLETLLLSPTYRNEQARDGGSNAGLLDGPWSDPDIATSFAMFWAENDSAFTHLPPRIGKHLRTQMFECGIPREKQFPFLFLGHGKCFFITEDERMGLCSPDTHVGDVVVGLHGGAVPFIIRPNGNDPGFGSASWSFAGSENMKESSFRFLGECYLHGRMTSAFFEQKDFQKDTMEVFNLY